MNAKSIFQITTIMVNVCNNHVNILNTLHKVLPLFAHLPLANLVTVLNGLCHVKHTFLR